eukprot:2170996-Rhodomonas_salina.3
MREEDGETEKSKDQKRRKGQIEKRRGEQESREEEEGARGRGERPPTMQTSQSISDAMLTQGGVR